MKIAIFGAGAIGLSLAALFSGKEDAVLIVKDEARAEELSRGIRLNGKEVSVKACLAQDAGEFGLVILATKQRDTAAALPALGLLMGGSGALLTVQNGLPERALEEAFGKDRVYGCAVSYGAERTQGGVKITSEAGIRFALGTHGGGEQLQKIGAALGKIGQVQIGDLDEIRFAKLAVNASFSTLSALSGLPFGALATKYKKYALMLIREVFAVARAAGCRRLPLNGHDLFRVFGAFAPLTLPIAMKKYAHTRSGMLLDLEAGRRCDIDDVAGACVRAGAEKGVETPHLKRAVALVHDVENGLAEIAPESLELLREEVER